MIESLSLYCTNIASLSSSVYVLLSLLVPPGKIEQPRDDDYSRPHSCKQEERSSLRFQWLCSLILLLISQKLNVRSSVIADFLKNHWQILILSYKQLTLWTVYKHSKFSSRRIYFSETQYPSVFLNKQSHSHSTPQLGRLSFVLTWFLKEINVAATSHSFSGREISLW